MSVSMTASMIATPATPAVAQLPAKSKTPEPERVVQHESIDSTTTSVQSSITSNNNATSIVTNGVSATTNGTTPLEIEQVAATAIDEIVAAATDVVLQKARSVDRDSLEGDERQNVAVDEHVENEVAEPQSIEQEKNIVVIEPVVQQQQQQQQQPSKPTIKAVSELNGTHLLNDSTDNGDLMTGKWDFM